MTELEKLKHENNFLREENRLLREKLDYVLRQLYGAKSEKLDASQLELLLDPEAAKKPVAAVCEEDAPAAENIVPIETARRQNNRRHRLPENLPVTEETIVPDEVQEAPDRYRRIGEQTSERLEVEPARYSRHRIIRPVYVERSNPLAVPFTAPLPPCMLEGSMLSPSLLAHILTAKFNDHLPFHRQEQILDRRHGIHINRATFCNWAELAADRLEPLYKTIAADIRSSSRVNIDETPVDYLDRQNGGTSQGYFWVYRTPHTALYNWHTGRGHSCLDAILTSPSGNGPNFTGLIQCDGYSAYGTWQRKHPGITLLGCWAHARRKFNDALPNQPEAAHILRLIQQLYHREKQYRHWIQQRGHPPEAIAHYRRRRDKPLLQQIRSQLLQLKNRHLPKSELGKAIDYALNQWHRLCLAWKHSATLDNNIAENAVRPLKLGAKNWLFIGGEDTGWRSAIIYTLVENCRLQNIDPFAYLKWVFETLPTTTNRHDLHHLLPQAYAATLKAAKASPVTRRAAA